MQVYVTPLSVIATKNLKKCRNVIDSFLFRRGVKSKALGGTGSTNWHSSELVVSYTTYLF